MADDLEILLDEIAQISSNCAEKNMGPKKAHEETLRLIGEFSVQRYQTNVVLDAEDAIREDERVKLAANNDVAAGDVDRLHEAICEGRKQDAIDMLNDLFPDADLRSVVSQNNLFPSRVQS